MNLTKSLFVIFLSTLSITALAKNNYTFDKNHTYVDWSVDHFGYSDVSGKFFAEGTLQFDEQKPTTSTFNIVVKIDSIATGIPKFDKKLLGRNFFNAEKFPTATLKSKKITRKAKNKGIIDGEVTIKGVTKPMKLEVTMRKYDIHPFFKRPAIGFIAYGKLKRSDFGIRAYTPRVSDEVIIEIHAEAIQDKPKSTE